MRRKAQIKAVLARGRSTRASGMQLYTLAGDGGPRLAVVVARRILPRAVDRNRFKRVVRETFRTQKNSLLPGDYIVRGRDGLDACVAASDVAALFGAWRRSGAGRSV